MIKDLKDQKQTQIYTPSHYSQLANTYNRNQFDSIIKLLKNLAYKTHYNKKYPILKLLKAVCRRLLINQFQSIFFAYVVQTNKWNINDNIIVRYCQDVRDIVCYSTQQAEYKAVIMYLLLCGYTVKYYLNQQVQMYINELDKICQDFKSIFQQWAKQYAQSTLKINPKNLNKVYKYIYLRSQPNQIQSDYNSLVDNLLQISPSYNPQKQKSKQITQHKPNNSKYKKQQFFTGKIIPNSILGNSIGNLSNISLFDSSGIFAHLSQTGMGTSSLYLKKKQFSLGSSVYGLDNIGNIEDQLADIGDVTLGVCKVVESDSEQKQIEPKMNKLVKKEDGREQRGELAFKKITSNTSEYINT